MKTKKNEKRPEIPDGFYAEVKEGGFVLKPSNRSVINVRCAFLPEEVHNRMCEAFPDISFAIKGKLDETKPRNLVFCGIQGTKTNIEKIKKVLSMCKKVGV